MAVALRNRQIDEFLEETLGEEATHEPLAGDASFRRYERVHFRQDSYVLMDAPPDKEDIRPFVTVAEFLLKQGLSAPKVVACDLGAGLLLLEDLGDALYSRFLAQFPEEELALYTVAVDALISLHQSGEKPNVPAYDEALFLQELGLFTEWFLPLIVEDSRQREMAIAEYEACWRSLLPLCRNGMPTDVPVLRDYHADNLLWLPERDGIARAGQLDFQDAVLGPVTYDLVSLLEDARRDVSTDTAEAMITHYLAAFPAVSPDAFYQSYAVMGAQRNLKIIGIFVRLCVRDGKANYLSFLPRVWGHLAHDLQHPALAPVRAWLDQYIPVSLRGIPEVKAA